MEQFLKQFENIVEGIRQNSIKVSTFNPIIDYNWIENCIHRFLASSRRAGWEKEANGEDEAGQTERSLFGSHRKTTSVLQNHQGFQTGKNKFRFMFEDRGICHRTRKLLISCATLFHFFIFCRNVIEMKLFCPNWSLKDNRAVSSFFNQILIFISRYEVMTR